MSEHTPHAHYWKVKAAVVEAQLVQVRAKAAVDAALAKQLQALTDAGLDPNVDYEFHDANETILPLPVNG